MKRLNYLSKDDYYEVRFGSMLASYDRDILTMLYQPIIGHLALSLYFTLWSEIKRCEYTTMCKHELLAKEMNVELTDLLNARLALEGIGLLKTYKYKLSNTSESYIYEVFAPKSPEEFFKDVIFKGLLASKIGEKEVEKLSMIFSSKTISNDVEDITVKFSDVYNINEDESLKVMTVKTRRGRKTLSIETTFEVGELLKEIATTENISSNAFTADDCQEMSRIATLFGLDVLTMKDVVMLSYNPDDENHLDYKKMLGYAKKFKNGYNIAQRDDKVASEYEGNDNMSKVINECNRYSSYDYLKMKQGFTNPAPSDVKIINILSSEYKLNPPVINVIIDYTLKQCDNTLPSAYIEKIASTLVRKNVTTAVAAINALKPKKNKKNKTQELPVSKEETNDNTTSDVNLEELMNMLK